MTLSTEKYKVDMPLFLPHMVEVFLSIPEFYRRGILFNLMNYSIRV